MDFLKVTWRNPKKNGPAEIYPVFIVKSSKDLMIKGGDFYAIWDSIKGTARIKPGYKDKDPNPSEDKERNFMNVMVFDISTQLNQENIFKSPFIICPICKEPSKFEIKNHRIKIYNCKIWTYS